MTVTVEIAGRSLEIAPYMLGDLEAAADFIDEMNARMAATKSLDDENKGKPDSEKKQPKFKEMTGLLRCLVEILAVGTVKADPEMTADAIMKLVDLTFMNSLQTAVFTLLASSGFARAGEMMAPSLPPATDGALASPDTSAE